MDQDKTRFEEETIAQQQEQIGRLLREVRALQDRNQELHRKLQALLERVEALESALETSRR